MPTITLKDIPAALHIKLKERAQTNHRSLNKEILAALRESTLAHQAFDPARFLAETKAARSKFRRSVTAREIQNWKTQGRL